MMMWSLMFAASALAGPGPATPVSVSVAVDSSKHELTITAGPYDLPNMPPMEDHGMMDLGMSHDTPVQQLRVADRRLVPRLPRGPGRRQGPAGARGTSCTT